MADRFLAGFVIALSVFYALATSQVPTVEIGDPLGPRVFPYIIAGLGFAAGVWLFVEAQARRLARDGVGGEVRERHHPLAVCAVLGWMLLFYLVLESLGFVLGGSVFLLGLTAYFNRGRWLMNVLVSALFPLGVYLAFGWILGITLPRGVLPF